MLEEELALLPLTPKEELALTPKGVALTLEELAIPMEEFAIKL